MVDVSKNRIRIIYVIILALLFQLFSPTIFALTTDFKQSGKLFTICTMQGYKQVWINLDDEQHGTNSVDLSCPYCLLNISVLDAINTNTKYYFNPVDEHVYSSIVIQNNIQPKALLKFLAIRAPPYLELMS
jgi:hypothetical protein